MTYSTNQFTILLSSEDTEIPSFISDKEITCNRDTRNKSLAICSYNEIREPSEIENGIFYIGACQEKNQLENQFLHIIKI